MHCKKNKLLLTGLLLVLAMACHRPQISTVWKKEKNEIPSLSRIMVAAIVPGHDTALRKTLENEFVDQLYQSGYPAVAAWQEFGEQGLSALDQQQTYLALASRGFDAVLTIAILDKKSYQSYNEFSQASNRYYFDRIWSYKKTRDDSTGSSLSSDYFCESILFDLKALQTLVVLRTTAATNVSNRGETLSKLVLDRLRKRDILPVKTQSLKPF